MQRKPLQESHCQGMNALVVFILYLLFTSIFLFWAFRLHTTIFLETQACNDSCTTLCTNATSHIQFPFQVRSGQPPGDGGHPIYELDYNYNNKTTTINFPSYGDLVVKSISYDMHILHLLDPKNCVHEVFLNLNLSLTPFQYYYKLKEYSYLNCSVRLSPSVIEVPCLTGSDYHVYTVEPSLAVPNSCRVVKTVPIPFAYSPYLSDNSFGLELTWGSSAGDYGAFDKEDSWRSLHPITEQQIECFTMAHVKVACVVIFIFMVATLIRINMYRSEKLQCLEEGKDQIDGEKLLVDKAFMLEIYVKQQGSKSQCETKL